jgi:hypothetical protein
MALGEIDRPELGDTPEWKEGVKLGASALSFFDPAPAEDGMLTGLVASAGLVERSLALAPVLAVVLLPLTDRAGALVVAAAEGAGSPLRSDIIF